MSNTDKAIAFMREVKDLATKRGLTVTELSFAFSELKDSLLLHRLMCFLEDSESSENETNTTH